MKILPGYYRRILKLLHIRGSKLGGCFRRGNRVRAGTDRRKRSTDAPTGRHLQRCLDENVAHRRVGRIQEQFLPLQHSHLLRHALCDNAIQVSVERCNSLGNRQMKFVEVHVVAAPGEGLPIGGEDDSGNGVYGAGRTVIARNPFRSSKCQRARSNRQIDLGMIEFARRIAKVGDDLDGRLLPESRNRGKASQSNKGR